MPKNRQNETDQTGTILTEQVKQGAQSAAQQAQEAAGSLVGQAKGQTTTLLESRKDTATQSLTSVSQALRQTGQSLGTSDQAPIGQYVAKVADQIDRFTGYLESRNVRELVGETEMFARRSPAVFLGGAFALGLVGARFLKSSSPSNVGRSGYSGGYGQQGYTHDVPDRGYAGASVGFASGTYDYSDVPHSTEHVDGAPAVDVGYAPGLMGTETQRRTGDGA